MSQSELIRNLISFQLQSHKLPVEWTEHLLCKGETAYEEAFQTVLKSISFNTPDTNNNKNVDKPSVTYGFDHEDKKENKKMIQCVICFSPQSLDYGDNYVFPKLEFLRRKVYEQVDGEHTHPNFGFTMPTTLPKAYILFNQSEEFRVFWKDYIHPILSLDALDFLTIVKGEFPFINSYWKDSTIMWVLSAVSSVIDKARGYRNIPKNGVNVCRFFFNFKTLSKLNKALNNHNQ